VSSTATPKQKVADKREAPRASELDPELTEEEEAEKRRLQLVVTTFVRKASRGYQSTLFKQGGIASGEASVERVPVAVRFDMSALGMTIYGSGLSVTCPLASVSDVYSVQDDGEGAFPKSIIGVLEEEELPLLLRVYYYSADKRKDSIFLLEENAEARDAFRESLRVLCIYAKSGGAEFT